MKSKRFLVTVLLVLLLAALIVPAVMGAAAAPGASQPEPIGTPVVNYCGCFGPDSADSTCPDYNRIDICY